MGTDFGPRTRSRAGGALQHHGTRAALAALGALAALALLLGARPAQAAAAAAATVTIDQASGQADPTSASPIVFTAVFNQSVTGFQTGDVTLSGTAGATTATVIGSGSTYTINVMGMTSSGTVIATIAANVVTDGNSASTSTDNTVSYTAETVKPSVTVEQGPSQSDPATAGPIVFRAVFSEPVTGFADGDVTLGGTAGATTANVTGSGTTYTISVTGMTQPGTVTASIAANRVTDLVGNQNVASTSVDNSVTYNPPVDTTKPTVTVEQGPGQADPTTTSPVVFRAVFSEAVTGFASGDVTLGGTAGATTASISGSGTTYTISVTGMTQTGTVTASIGAGKVTDAAGNGNTASTSADNAVTYTFTTTRPSVKVEQASAQGDPTTSSPVLFTAVFSEPVSGFAPGDVTLAGTAGATTVALTGSGTTYTISVSGMTKSGTVIASIGANVVTDAGGDGNLASTSTDNTVTYQAPVTIALAHAGDRRVGAGRSLGLRVHLTTVPADSACRAGKTVTFSIDRNPGPLGEGVAVPGVEGSWITLGTGVSSSTGRASLSVRTTGWAPGSYRVLAVLTATSGCPGGSAIDTITIVRRGIATQGSGWIAASGRTDFVLAVQRIGDGPNDVRGSITVTSTRRWKLVGTPTSVVTRACDRATCADVTGTGKLYERVKVRYRRAHGSDHGRSRWVLRSRDVQFVLRLVDGGRSSRDRFGVQLTTPGLEGLRGTTGGDTASLRRGFVDVRG
jgi:hypothetical protein